MTEKKKTSKPKTRKKTTVQSTARKTQKKGETTVEEIKVAGNQLVDKVKELIKEGNIRSVLVKQKGKVILEVPLTVATIGVVFAPVLAALGALAALVSECTLEIVKEN